MNDFTPSRRKRTLVLLCAAVAVALLAAAPLRAADVWLTNGQVYRNATIVSRDDTRLVLRDAAGKTVVVLPMMVRKVEGAEPAPVAAQPGAQPGGAVPPVAAAAATPTGPVVAGELPPPPSATPVWVPGADKAEPKTEPAAAPDKDGFKNGVRVKKAPEWPPYEHDWAMDYLLLALLGVAVLWPLSVGAVQRSLFFRRVDPRGWTSVAVLLPVVGCLLYFILRGMAKLTRGGKDAAGSGKSDFGIDGKTSPNELSGSRPTFEFLDANHQPLPLKALQKSGDFAGLDAARKLLAAALAERASDVLIDPFNDEYRARFRVDGLLQQRMTLTFAEGQRAVATLKALAELDTNEKRLPQKGRFLIRKTGGLANDAATTATAHAGEITLRVATASTAHGENIAVSLLHRQSALLGAEKLGMEPELLAAFRHAVHARRGVVAVAGPSGSGKTATLYAALAQFDAQSAGIVTVEDPVEYELAGVLQMAVNPQVGATFASGLEFLLNQNPKVVLLGELREAEAAKVALRAVSEGRLLLTSLPAGNVFSAARRMEELGLGPAQLAKLAEGGAEKFPLTIVAQRLVRTLCPLCRQAVETQGNELLELGFELPAGVTIYRPKGCPGCRHTGYVGRTGVFELATFDDALRDGLARNLSDPELFALARENGLKTFREDGAAKILLGLTSVEEIVQLS